MVALQWWFALTEVMDLERIRILKLHKGWADKFTLVWQIFILISFGGMYFFLEQMGVDAAERAGALVLLAVMVLVAAIWQAVGMGIARIHMLLQGIDLQRPLGNTRRDTNGSE